ncbi:hypothetical protein NSK_005469 [Nannochloropsis salina CCMP1776]|uniref:Uncharacterized protein n=1 Tax=Nannochloropsis salina CCMP1776 TaxID=1027361 RepID=A0A4D9CXK8_9STRA|nr:hypothetical protein NSK_005469 [Nannochloropsis salina CCMP1776]|eukprot:TFJ83224.1 hypothetical protein NSK_005469 [Nannochloropsis salina CCMP1776]
MRPQAPWRSPLPFSLPPHVLVVVLLLLCCRPLTGKEAKEAAEGSPTPIDAGREHVGPLGLTSTGPKELESEPLNFLYEQMKSQAELLKEGYACFVTGECIACSAEEMSQAFCQTSKRREEVTCEREEVVDGATHMRTYTTYSACARTSSDSLVEVLRFQAAMAMVGGLAFYGARHQKG